MIKRLPGWLNFIVLSIFYYGILWTLRLISGLEADNNLLIIIALFFSGAYLSKWRQTQGGGWSFNGFGGKDL